MVPTSSITPRMSDREAVVALSLRSVRPERLAMMLATVVFPVPEGP